MKVLFFFLMVSTMLAQRNTPRQVGSGAPLPPCSTETPTLTVRILSPLSSSTSNVGDVFTTTVELPEQLKSAVVEGRVIAVHRAEKGFDKTKATLQMEFASMVIAGRSCGLTAQLTDVTNSKGVANVDEEGQAVARNSNKKRVLATAGGILGGAVIGVLKGGATGAAVGGIAGGAAAFVLSSELSSTSSNIEFKPGSLFTLRLSDPKHPQPSR